MIGFLRQRGEALGKTVTALVFPDKCVKCGHYIRRDPKIAFSACYCRACLGKGLPEFLPPFCSSCGHVFSSRAGENHLCATCLKKPPGLNKVRAAFEYTGLIQEALGLFKYQSRLSLATPLERHLFEAFETWFDPETFHLLLPIPLHAKKVRQRGFNQSFLLVRNFAFLYRKKYNRSPPWEIDIRSLIRTRYTPSQTGLNIKERKKNLNQAFLWRSPRDLNGKNVLLVDDVYTTGATCGSAAGTLRAAGAKMVSALVLARA